MDPRHLLPGLLTIAVVSLSIALGVVSLDPADGGGARALAGTSPPSPPSPRHAGPDAGPDGPADVLRSWDHRRAQAWARGDARALANLYVPGSRTGEADVAGLRRWTLRGLRVVGLRTQFLEVATRSVTSRRLRLIVTDRLVGGAAVGRRGVRVPLPVDRASTRAVTLERVAGRWLVAEVRAERSRPG